MIVEIEGRTIVEQWPSGKNVSILCMELRVDGELTGATRVTRLISRIVPPERLDTKASFLAL